MSLARLADVELQLVMQGLDASELLQLARCSKQMMHAADSPFAWQHCNPPRSLGARVGRRLLVLALEGRGG
jgi:hypothetical protein